MNRLRSWGCEESDMTERPHFHFSLLCIGEGNGNPLQCSCLENPRDGGAWWAAVYGVAQSQTQLTRLSSSSSSIRLEVSNLRGISFLNRQCVQRTHITKETTVYMYNPRLQVSNQKLVEGI